MTAQGRRRLALAVSLAVAAGAMVALLAGDVGQDLVYYWDPTELHDAGPRAIGATIRLGGQVVPGSVRFDASTGALTFDLTDGRNTARVVGKGTPPAMFREGIGAVVEGTAGTDGVFHASRLLVKHDNQYRAPVDGKHDKGAFESVEGL